MATKSKRHVHKYYQAKVLDGKVWACFLSNCNHHMPPHYANLMEGKASICWKCDKEMILDSINMEMEKPICFDCRMPDIESYLESKDMINPLTGK